MMVIEMKYRKRDGDGATEMTASLSADAVQLQQLNLLA